MKLALETVASNFEYWRQTRTKRTKIPEELWKEAISLHPDYRVSDIVKTLRLGRSDYNKKREEYTNLPVVGEQQDVNFIQIQTPLPEERECFQDEMRIEVHKADGAQLKVTQRTDKQLLLSIVNCFIKE